MCRVRPFQRATFVCAVLIFVSVILGWIVPGPATAGLWFASVAAWAVSFSIWVYRSEKVHAFRKRCFDKVDELTKIGDRESDLEEKIKLLRRRVRVLDLCQESINKEEIPSHMSLEDL